MAKKLCDADSFQGKLSHQAVNEGEAQILTNSLAFTEAPLSQSNLTLEAQPAITRERKEGRQSGKRTSNRQNIILA